MATTGPHNDRSPLWDRFCNGDRRALARLLTLVACGERTDEIRQALAQNSRNAGNIALTAAHEGKTPSKKCRTIAITGSGGVGKSTLIGRLIEHARRQGNGVAVLACDPQSSITGGALLGDRIRMPSRPDDDGLFIRSLATPSGHSGVAPHVELLIQLLNQFGFSTVLLETVGSGQGDTAVRDVADVVVVLVQPETGDELQWEKAGQLEIADVIVVHKSDLSGADRMESQLRELLNMPGARPVSVVRVSSSKAQGIDELWTSIQSIV